MLSHTFHKGCLPPSVKKANSLGKVINWKIHQLLRPSNVMQNLFFSAIIMVWLLIRRQSTLLERKKGDRNYICHMWYKEIIVIITAFFEIQPSRSWER